MPVLDHLQIHQLDLEIHGACNYQCEMCPQAWGREKAFLKIMSFDLFKKIVDDAMQYGLKGASLHGSGEPTLNRHMPEMVRYLKERGIHTVSFTNGLKLNPQLMDALLDAGLDLLRVSAIGYDEDSYARWMKPKVYQAVRDNLREFVRRRDAKKSMTQIQLYHLITDLGQKDEEIALYRENWAEYTGAQAEVWLMHNWSGSYEKEVPYHRDAIALSRKRRSCGRPFSPLLEVRAGGLDGHSGAVVACCLVLGQDSKAVLGHLDHQTIQEIVAGAAYQELRSAHEEGRFDDISYCSKCDFLYDVPEALVWTNIPGRKYGQSSIASGLDHRSFAPSDSGGGQNLITITN
jgi:uncharacterized Fe-S cluster-containing radical SAM superfamily protein